MLLVKGLNRERPGGFPGGSPRTQPAYRIARIKRDAQVWRTKSKQTAICRHRDQYLKQVDASSSAKIRARGMSTAISFITLNSDFSFRPGGLEGQQHRVSSADGQSKQNAVILFATGAEKTPAAAAKASSMRAKPWS